MAAGLFQVPVEHLQHVVALARGRRPRPKSCSTWGAEGAAMGHTGAERRWTSGALDQGGALTRAGQRKGVGVGRERVGGRAAEQSSGSLKARGQEVMVPSDTGQPSARSSCGSAAAGTSVVTPCTMACSWAHHPPPVSTTQAPSSGSLGPPPLLTPAARPTHSPSGSVCRPPSLWPVPGVASVQPSSGPQGGMAGPLLLLLLEKLAPWVWGSLGHWRTVAVGGGWGWGCWEGQQQGHSRGLDLGLWASCRKRW